MSATTAQVFIATDEAVAELAAEIADAELVAVDTEFVREKTYYPQLCVLQVATDRRAACVDCLAAVDLAPLYGALFRPGCTWLIHSARQDLEVVWQRTDRLPPRLIDTQVAAAFAGMPPQIGLEGLLERAIGVTLGESYARTDWSRRPLPKPALEYAIDDVRYLLPAWRELEARLRSLGRLAWVEEDSARLLAEPPVADTQAIWARLKGLQALPLEAQCAALALVRWRELAAQRADRPRRWLMADEVLLALADAAPRTAAALEQHVTPKLAARHGDELLTAIGARSDPSIEAIVRAGSAQLMPDRRRIKALQEAVRARAERLGIEPEILATRRDLAALAVGNPPGHLRTGWRAAELEHLTASGAG